MNFRTACILKRLESEGFLGFKRFLDGKLVQCFIRSEKVRFILVRSHVDSKAGPLLLD